MQGKTVFFFSNTDLKKIKSVMAFPYLKWAEKYLCPAKLTFSEHSLFP